MFRPSGIWFAGALCLTLLGGCGGGGGGSQVTGPGTGPSGSGPMTATIDGVAWASDALPAGQGVFLVSAGSYVIVAQKVLSPTNAFFLTLQLYNITGPGTYPLGVGPTVFGGIGQLGDAAGGWSTPLSGAAGTVTITTLTATRIAGTFSFTATPITGGATGTRTVTQGTFDYPILTSGSVGPVPDHAGSRLSANVGGAPWNASTVIASVFSVGGNDVMIVSTSNTLGVVTMTLTGVATGAFALNNTSPLVSLGISTTAPGASWGGSVSFGTGGTVITNDIGTITVTSRTSTRVRGTFSGTLAPAPGSSVTGSMVVSGGEFDLGLPPPPAPGLAATR